MVIGIAPSLAAQAGGDVEQRGRENGGARPPQGYYTRLMTDTDAFQFSRDNGWTVRARALGAARSAQRAESGGPMAARSVDGVFQGTLRMPIFLALYTNTDSTALVAHSPMSSLQSRMLGTAAAPPYTLTTYYDEISDGRLEVTGDVLEWRRVSEDATFYEGGAGCQGLCGNARVGNLIQELVVAWDPTVDFGQYDNDGPDGIPNSGDDDGFVDAVVIFHPDVDGACRAVNTAATNTIWAHRWVVAGWGVTIITNDVSAKAGFGNIRVRDYIIQGGQGGNSGCASNQPQAPGVVAHETGHLLGLPDLYNTGAGVSQGIGEWGLMSSGNYRVPTSPAYMEAWSRAELGWVTEVVAPVNTTIDLSPVQTSDTVLIIPIPETTEYFLLENRQALGSDGQIRGPGLLIWHVDSALMASRRFSNTVNASLPHALALEQADGADHLMNGTNRGDAGDPFPGSSNRTIWNHNTTPGSAGNSGTPSWASLEQIQQLTPGGAVRFLNAWGVPVTINVVGPGVVTSAGNPVSGTAAIAAVTEYAAQPNEGSIFVGWSGDTVTTQANLLLHPGHPWNVTTTFAAPLVLSAGTVPPATMGAPFQHTLTATGGPVGHVWTMPSGALPPGLIHAGGTISGTPTQVGTFTANIVVTSGALQMGVQVPITVSAPTLATSAVVEAVLGNMGALTANERNYLDLLGNQNGQLDIGDFLAWVTLTGATPSAAHMAAIQRLGGAP
ncbi:MAG: M6 family metalloprotease domain-containing protein [Gemmatimonadales bacterium]